MLVFGLLFLFIYFYCSLAINVGILNYLPISQRTDIIKVRKQREAGRDWHLYSH